MQGEQTGQVDIFNQMIFERLIPKDHLLVEIDKIVSFDFVRDLIKSKYSSKQGRKSYDPILMFKICLLQYLYNLSDREVASRIQTDIVFRWFLRLGLDDKTPDYTTISNYRIKRLGDDISGKYFQEIVIQCIELGLVKTRRYIVDTTNVDANVNYPSAKKMLCQAYYRLIRELEKVDEVEASFYKTSFESDIKEAKNQAEKEAEAGKKASVKIEIFCEIGRKYAEKIYLKYSQEIQTIRKLGEYFTILWDIIEDYCEGSKDKDRIISAIDPEARVAYKRAGVMKRGYKQHILIDEDSEIILTSIETPFNIPDEKKLEDLVENTINNYKLKPKELSADKAYGSIDNRAYLKDNEIKCNIMLYNDKDKEYKKYEITEFQISEDLKSATCPNNCTTNEFSIIGKGQKISLKFQKKDCLNCPLRKECFTESDLKKGVKRRSIIIPIRYDVILDAREYNETEEFIEAINKRYIVERRFATLVRNHGLRVSRYLRLKGASLHTTLANIACNIVRMVKLLTDKKHLGEVMLKNGC